MIGTDPQYESILEQLEYWKTQALSDCRFTDGTANRRGLNNWLESNWTQADERTVVYVDIDHFGTLNEVWGHRTADQILSVLCSRLNANVKRDRDIVSSVGGDEFVLVFAEAISSHVVDRIMSEAFKPFNINDDVIYVTGSYESVTSYDKADTYESCEQAAERGVMAFKAARDWSFERNDFSGS